MRKFIVKVSYVTKAYTEVEARTPEDAKALVLVGEHESDLYGLSRMALKVIEVIPMPKAGD